GGLPGPGGEVAGKRSRARGGAWVGAAGDARQGGAVELDDPLLRGGISRLDARDQLLRPFSALLLTGQTRCPRRGCGRILARGRRHPSPQEPFLGVGGDPALPPQTATSAGSPKVVAPNR